MPDTVAQSALRTSRYLTYGASHLWVPDAAVDGTKLQDDVGGMDCEFINDVGLTGPAARGNTFWSPFVLPPEPSTGLTTQSGYLVAIGGQSAPLPGQITSQSGYLVAIGGTEPRLDAQSGYLVAIGGAGVTLSPSSGYLVAIGGTPAAPQGGATISSGYLVAIGADALALNTTFPVAGTPLIPTGVPNEYLVPRDTIIVRNGQVKRVLDGRIIGTRSGNDLTIQSGYLVAIGGTDAGGQGGIDQVNTQSGYLVAIGDVGIQSGYLVAIGAESFSVSGGTITAPAIAGTAAPLVPIGPWLQFNSTTNYMRSTPLVPLRYGTTMSVEFVASFGALPTALRSVFSMSRGGAVQPVKLTFGMNPTGAIALSARPASAPDGAFINAYVPAANVALNQLYHIVGVIDGTNILLYQNGVLRTTVAFAGGMATNADSIDLNRGSGVMITGMGNGVRLGATRFYGYTALSQTQVTALYAEAKKQYPSIQ